MKLDDLTISVKADGPKLTIELKRGRSALTMPIEQFKELIANFQQINLAGLVLIQCL